jgi:hypothetical protein
MMDLHLVSLANSLMFSNSVREEFSAASSAGDQICVLIAVVVFFLLELIGGRFATDGFFLLLDYAQGTFADIGFFYHGADLAGFLMGDQRFCVEPS